jgi:hypothetical protein
MDRIVHKSNSHAEALRWDIEQHVRMSPEERMEAARILKERSFPSDAKDVREWHRSGLFDEAWVQRETAIMVDGDIEIPVHSLGLDSLIRNKEATGRPKDLDDLQYLRRKQGA